MHQCRVNYFEDNDIAFVGKLHNNDKQTVRGYFQVQDVESPSRFPTHCFQIFTGKKSLSAKMFFSLTTKNINWEILTKNLVTFKRWDKIKDEKF